MLPRTTRLLFVLAILLLVPFEVYATHIRAGQITAERDLSSTDPLAYRFTLELYRDKTGVEQADATLDMGVTQGGQGGNVLLTANLASRRDLGGFAQTEVLTYYFKYTYPGYNTYTVSFTERNRNREVVNMALSGETPFHIETTFIISPTLGLNNSVVLLNPPIDRATVGQRFCHNPAAFDADGDSLSYRLVVPLQKMGLIVNNYSSPETVTP
ncbi:MAG: gliding motility-associated C-terminal domain-containing protein, partial [Cytophagales bacterium]|nr:gliding motility-associated C-terminal domain-containing protein [Cytophagales bacterium]